jgi:hypothetical protein
MANVVTQPQRSNQKRKSGTHKVAPKAAPAPKHNPTEAEVTYWTREAPTAPAPAVPPKVQQVLDEHGVRLVGTEAHPSPAAARDSAVPAPERKSERLRAIEAEVLAAPGYVTYDREYNAPLRALINELLDPLHEDSLARGALLALADDLHVLANNFIEAGDTVTMPPNRLSSVLIRLAYRASAAAELDARVTEIERSKGGAR